MRAHDLMLIGAFDLVTGMSGHYLTAQRRLVIVGITWLRLNHEDTWTTSRDQTLTMLCLVDWTCVSRHPVFYADREPMTLF
jgi:hypothetical protein